MPAMTGAHFIAKSLESYGVSHVFFVPAIMSHTLAALDISTGVKRIMTHGEKSAVYMADGYARASGRVGVSFAQCIGAANLAAGLRDAWLACTPLMVFTGGPYPQTRGRHFYQQINDLPLFSPVTKFSERVDNVSRLPDLMRQAFRSATTGTPGPTHLELNGHRGELEQEVADLDLVPEPRFGSVPPFRPVADMESLVAVARLLEQAERPIMIVGGGARMSGAGREVIALAERLSIPIATSLNAKDLVPASHPLAIGVPGQYSRKSANKAVLDADLVFFVGSHTGSQVTFNWQIPRSGTRVIQLDIDPAELGRHYPNVVSLCGDAKASLGPLLSMVDAATKVRRLDWVARVQSLARDWRGEFASQLNSDAVPIHPARLCHELSELLPADALVVVDTGHAGMWTGAMLDLKHAEQGYIRAAGSLGWGLPAALGAKLAVGPRPVLLFTGDGGFWYHLSELETAVRWNIAAVLLVNNNKSLNMEIDIYTDAYGGSLKANHAELWKFADVSFAAIAEQMGAKGLTVRKPNEIDSALDQAFSCGRPCVIDVLTEIEALAPTAFIEPQ
jgi:acetolactate synthase-1/2/3 large subunit